jgi:hypothetical protein
MAGDKFLFYYNDLVSALFTMLAYKKTAGSLPAVRVYSRIFTHPAEIQIRNQNDLRA